MKKLGIIIHHVKKSNIYLLHIGWGKIKYFTSKENINIKHFNGSISLENVVLYDEKEFDDDEEYAEEENSRNNLQVYNIESIIDFVDIGYLKSMGKYEIFRYELLEAMKYYDNEKIEITSQKKNLNVPSKFVAYTDGYKLFEIDPNDYSRYSSIKIDDISTALLYLVFGRNRFDSLSSTDFFTAYIKAKHKVDSYDLRLLIKNVKVYVKRISYTHRGSDNYIVADHYLETEYGYENDTFLDKFLPFISLCIYSFDESKDSWVDKTNKLSYIEEEKLAKAKTEEVRSLALNLFITKYNKDEHIFALMFEELYGSEHSNGRRYYDFQQHLDEVKGIAKAIWLPPHYVDDMFFYKISKENCLDMLINHNNRVNPPYFS